MQKTAASLNSRRHNTLQHFLVALLVVTSFGVFTTSHNAALPDMVNGQTVPSLAPVIKRSSPAVVNIQTRGSVEAGNNLNPFFSDPFFEEFFGRRRQQPQRRETQSAGSGVIVDAKQGIILTNHHVIDNADEILVQLQDGSEYEAEKIGSDKGSDIGVLKIKAKDLSQLSIADSDDLQVGDFVVAIGNPFGFGHTVTSGIVSGLSRSGLSRDAYEDFIQTDAAINPGNSGGALINLKGELVGINAAIISRSGGNLGIGFAIPSNMAKSIMQQIMEHGEVKRGLLGVTIQDVTDEHVEALKLKSNKGASILSVTPGSAAEEAGLQPLDVVTRINDEEIDGSADLRNTVGLLREGDKVSIEYYRDGKRKNVKVRLGSNKTLDAKTSAKDVHPKLVGVEFGEVTEQSQAGDVKGVRVVSIEANSRARRFLVEGDIITHVGRRPAVKVNSVKEFSEAVEGQNILIFRIQRG
ncbi:MAG: DegQ family serine endoprotease, partial [Gammaproteobacteria bacterium]|nr:DegQ family serine endoprotease [Gammaproteobacteria bacterium]